MRYCVKCGAGDCEVVETFEEQMDKTTLRKSLQPVIGHYVRPDLYFLDKVRPLSESEKRSGFEFKMIDGKPSKFRLLCDKCFAAQELTKEWRRSFREEAAKREDDSNLKNSLFVQEWSLNTE